MNVTVFYFVVRDSFWSKFQNIVNLVVVRSDSHHKICKSDTKYAPPMVLMGTNGFLCLFLYKSSVAVIV